MTTTIRICALTLVVLAFFAGAAVAQQMVRPLMKTPLDGDRRWLRTASPARLRLTEALTSRRGVGRGGHTADPHGLFIIVEQTGRIRGSYMTVTVRESIAMGAVRLFNPILNTSS